MGNLEKELFVDNIHKESCQRTDTGQTAVQVHDLTIKCLLLADTRTDIWDFFYLFKHGSKPPKNVIKGCILNSWLLFKPAVIKHFQKTETMYPNQTNVQMFLGQITTFRGESPCEVMVGQVVTGMFRKYCNGTIFCFAALFSKPEQFYYFRVWELCKTSYLGLTLIKFMI